MRAQCVVVKVVQGPMIHEEYSIAYRFTSMRHLCCQVHTSLARFPQIRNNDTRQRTSACMSACLTLCTLDVSRLGTRDSGGVRRRPYRTGPTAARALSLERRFPRRVAKPNGRPAAGDTHRRRSRGRFSFFIRYILKHEKPTRYRRTRHTHRYHSPHVVS
jgi:hypothetical protein